MTFFDSHTSVACRTPNSQRRRVVQLSVEIQTVKEAQKSRYANNVGGGGDVVRRVQSNLRNLAKSDHANYHPSKPDDGNGNIAAVSLAGRQQEELQRMRQVDATEIDADLDEIHEGIKQLHELALRQGEEVRKHGDMLDVVNNRVDNSCVCTMKAASKVERYVRKTKKLY